MIEQLQPIPAVLESSQPLTGNDRLFNLRSEAPLTVAPGQFVEISIPGVGAFPVSPCDLSRDSRICTCIRRAGRVTSALFGLGPGSRIGLRGPFGNGFDPAFFVGRDVLMLAGGLGIAPLRALLIALLAAGRHRRLILLYGSKYPTVILFGEELVDLAVQDRLELRLAVDSAAGGSASIAGYPCRLGLVTCLLDDLQLQPDRVTAVVSGPPVLYRHVLERLASLGISPDRILATLERRMRCGIGECCHCVTGGVYLCQEGPVFSLGQLRQMEGAI